MLVVEVQRVEKRNELFALGVDFNIEPMPVPSLAVNHRLGSVLEFVVGVHQLAFRAVIHHLGQVLRVDDLDFTRGTGDVASEVNSVRFAIIAHLVEKLLA